MKVKELFFEDKLPRNVKKAWDISFPDKDALVTILDQHCSKNVDAYAKTNKFIYRGFSGNVLADHDYAIIDTSQSERVSKDSNNGYQALISFSPSLSAYPSRQKSLICSTNQTTAAVYTTVGDPLIVIPFDSTKVVGIPGVDDVMLRAQIDVFGKKITMSQVNNMVFWVAENAGHSIFETMSEEDVKKIDDSLSKQPKEWLAMMFFSVFCQVATLNISKFVSLQSSFISKLGNVPTYLSFRSVPYEKFMDEYQSLQIEKNLTEEGMKIFNWVSKNHSSLLGGFAKDFMTPQNLNLQWISLETLPEKTEVWMSGKCIAISQRAFRKYLMLNKD